MKKLVWIMLIVVMLGCMTGCVEHSSSDNDSDTIEELRTHKLDLNSKKGKKEFLKVLKTEFKEESWSLEYIRELREDENAWEEFKDSAAEILNENDDIETIEDFVDAYIEKSRQSADIDTVDEIVAAIETVYSENYSLRDHEAEIVIKKDGLSINNDALKAGLENLGISENNYLKSKQWGNVTIKVHGDGECIVTSDGELNIAGYYK